MRYLGNPFQLPMNMMDSYTKFSFSCSSDAHWHAYQTHYTLATLEKRHSLTCIVPKDDMYILLVESYSDLVVHNR